MQDRRLIQDDNRGLGQGVIDNQPVLNIFKLILENFDSCSRTQTEYPAGFLTVDAHKELSTLMHPMEKLIWHENEWTGVRNTYGSDRVSLESGIEIAVVRNLPHVPIDATKSGKSSFGLVVHRHHLEECATHSRLTGTVTVFFFWEKSIYLNSFFFHQR